MKHLPDLLTWQVPWHSDLDLYFALSDFDTIYVNVPDLLNYKAYNHQTLHSAFPQCMDSTGTLTQWPWPIFCASVTFTHFTSRFHIFSTIRPTTTLHSALPRCTDVAGTLTLWPWPMFCAPVTLTHFMSTFDISSDIRPTTTKPCIMLLLSVQTWQVLWPSDLDLYFLMQWLWHILFRRPQL